MRLDGDRLVAAPNHRYRSGQATAHVEGQVPLCIRDLPRAGLFGEMLIRFVNLAYTRRADRVTIADQTATWVHWNFE